eukprot:819888-Heterocapsa_arctica.AAC.1
MEPAFSATAWTTMSGLAAGIAHSSRGKMNKLRESTPQSACFPFSGPIMLSCWQGDPPMTRSMAPGSILARISWRRAPSSLS